MKANSNVTMTSISPPSPSSTLKKKSSSKCSTMSSSKLPFPFKLYQLLENASERGYEDIVSWADGGRSFKVHQTKLFTETVMKDYFKQTHFKSFTRQVSCVVSHHQHKQKVLRALKMSSLESQVKKTMSHPQMCRPPSILLLLPQISCIFMDFRN